MRPIEGDRFGIVVMKFPVGSDPFRIDQLSGDPFYRMVRRPETRYRPTTREMYVIMWSNGYRQLCDDMLATSLAEYAKQQMGKQV